MKVYESHDSETDQLVAKMGLQSQVLPSTTTSFHHHMPCASSAIWAILNSLLLELPWLGIA